MTIDSDNGIKTYVIYGVYDDPLNAQLQRYLIDSVDVLSYWNHLPLLFMVKTRLEAVNLSAKLYPFFQNRLFIVAEINPTNVNGILPQAAWQWFTTPAPPYKASSTNDKLMRLINP